MGTDRQTGGRKGGRRSGLHPSLALPFRGPPLALLVSSWDRSLPLSLPLSLCEQTWAANWVFLNLLNARNILVLCIYNFDYTFKKLRWVTLAPSSEHVHLPVWPPISACEYRRRNPSSFWASIGDSPNGEHIAFSSANPSPMKGAEKDICL